MLELGDVFDDPEYGRRVLSMVRHIDSEEDNGTQDERAGHLDTSVALGADLSRPRDVDLRMSASH